jgi:signal transduction histidine kinase
MTPPRTCGKVTSSIRANRVPAMNNPDLTNGPLPPGPALGGAPLQPITPRSRAPAPASASTRESKPLGDGAAKGDLALGEELRRLRFALEAALREADRLRSESAGRRGQYQEQLATLAHDLASPVNVVQGYTQLITESHRHELPPGVLDMLGEINSAVDFVRQLLQEVLENARIESGHLQLSREAVAVEELLDQVKRLNDSAAARKGIEIGLETCAELPEIRVDRIKLVQALSNLVDNAIKYSFPQSRITVRAEPKRTSIRLSVIDRGRGIPAEELPKLFRPFSRTSVQPTAGERSTGLGLVICKRIVEAHGGQIGVESVPGWGSTFHVTLPVP